MAERGVRFIQCSHREGDAITWDDHSNLLKHHPKLATNVDKPIAGLLADLHQRGLLDDTLVMWGGEFGRTPTLEGQNGRDHNPHGFTWWLAGGGLKPGFHFGNTDQYGSTPSRIESISTTCTRPCCTSLALTMNNSLGATVAATSV